MGSSTNPARDGAPASRDDASASRAHEQQRDRTSDVVPSSGDLLTTSTLTAWAWVRIGEQHGITLAEICDAAGMSEGELRDPGGFLTQRNANKIAELTAARVGPEAAMLGAQLLERGHFALPELVLRSAPTVRDAADRACEVFPLLHRGSQLVQEALPDRSIIRWQCSPELVVHPLYIELVFAICVQGIRRETGVDGARAAATWFQHGGPMPAREHERVLGPVRFNAPETRFELAAEVLDLPLLRSSASAHSSAVSVATEALRGVTPTIPLRRKS
jgi:hypothetical protein